MDEKRRCEDCVYWRLEPRDPHAGSSYSPGECRRFPPQLGSDGGGGWPITGPVDWCGEFTERPPRPDTASPA